MKVIRSLTLNLSPLFVTAIVLSKSEDVNATDFVLDSSLSFIYPNPSCIEVTISMPDEIRTPFNIELIDGYGRVISNNHYKNNENSKKSETINLRDILPGIYWVRIVSDKILKTQKLIVY